MFDPSSDIVIINETPREFDPKFARRRGAGRSKQRTTIEIQSEGLLHDFDENMLGAKPAEAIRDAITNGIKAITEIAAPATLAKRQAAAKAFSAGKAWALRQYSGGRTGPTPPNQTPRAFNDSGRLAGGIFVRQNPTDKTYTVNVTANRFDPADFGPGRFQAMLDKLRSLVPVIGDGQRLLADDKVRTAINESIRDLITKAAPGVDAARLKALAAARKRVVMQIVRALSPL